MVGDNHGLPNHGIVFISYAPEYFYTRLDELKIEMLAKATENARARVETMVKASGNRIGFIRSARMGVFQITPLTSTDVSDYGFVKKSNKTPLREKEIAVRRREEFLSRNQ